MTDQEIDLGQYPLGILANELQSYDGKTPLRLQVCGRAIVQMAHVRDQAAFTAELTRNKPRAKALIAAVNAAEKRNIKENAYGFLHQRVCWFAGAMTKRSRAMLDREQERSSVALFCRILSNHFPYTGA